MALGLVLMTGAGGIISFGQAAFLGIGAYATAWWTTVMGGSPFIGLAIGLFASGVTAAVLGAATLRLGGHFLPLSTIAWGIAIDYLFGNVEALGSHNGIAAIPPISIGPLSLVSAKSFYYFVWPLLGLAMLLCANLLDSREGRAIRALRGGNALVESLGIDAFRTRLRAFVLAALLASFAGWLYAHFQRVVSSTAFDLEAGIEFLLMALLGGASHVAGAVLGAGIVTLLKERCNPSCRSSPRTARSSRRWCSAPCSSSSCRGRASVSFPSSWRPAAAPAQRAVADARPFAPAPRPRHAAARDRASRSASAASLR